MTRDLTTTPDQEISLLKEYTQVLSKIVFLSKDIHFLEELKRKAKVTGISIPLIEEIKEEELKKEDVKLLMAKASALAPKVQKIYESYRAELGLGDHSGFLHCIHLFAPEVIEKGLSPIVIASDLICKLEGLKHKREREAKTPTPQPEQSGKASFISTLERKVVFWGSLATILMFLLYIYPKFVFVLTWFDIVLTWTDILIVITPLVLILGFLASIATLIMFVYWLRPLQR